MERDVLTDDEVERIILAAVATGEKTRGALERCVAWARGARVAALLLSQVLAGRILLDVTEDDVVFRVADARLVTREGG